MAVSLLTCERRKRGWKSLVAFARRLGYSVSYLSLIERGGRPAQPLVIQCYAQVLQLTPERIAALIPRRPLPSTRRKAA